MVTLYHRTGQVPALTIVLDKFEDGEGYYGTDRVFHGVWLSDRPLTVNEGIVGEWTLAVDINCEAADLRDYEWIEEGKPYREWLVPADMLNARRISVRIIDGPELSDSAVVQASGERQA